MSRLLVGGRQRRCVCHRMCVCFFPHTDNEANIQTKWVFIHEPFFLIGRLSSLYIRFVHSRWNWVALCSGVPSKCVYVSVCVCMSAGIRTRSIGMPLYLYSYINIIGHLARIYTLSYDAQIHTHTATHKNEYLIWHFGRQHIYNHGANILFIVCIKANTSNLLTSHNIGRMRVGNE